MIEGEPCASCVVIAETRSTSGQSVNAPSRPTETDGSGRTQRARQVAQVKGVSGPSPSLASSSWLDRGSCLSSP